MLTKARKLLAAASAVTALMVAVPANAFELYTFYDAYGNWVGYQVHYNGVFCEGGGQWTAYYEITYYPGSPGSPGCP